MAKQRAEDPSHIYAEKSQANRKYLAFAKQAEQEGFKQVAKLFRAAAEAETVHAHTHLRVAGGIADHHELRVARQQCGQAAPEKRVVVDDKDANGVLVLRAHASMLVVAVRASDDTG